MPCISKTEEYLYAAIHWEYTEKKINPPTPTLQIWLANSVDPDQTTPEGAIWAGSAQFANAILSEEMVCTKF